MGPDIEILALLVARWAGVVCANLLLAACGGEATGPAAASAPPDPGRAAFRACAVCHSVADPATPDGQIRLAGPNLHGVYGAPAGRLEDFAYSNAMKTSGVVWNAAALDAYIASPGDFIRGNRMAFSGEADAEQRAAIIDYLKRQGQG